MLACQPSLAPRVHTDRHTNTQMRPNNIISSANVGGKNAVRLFIDHRIAGKQSAW